ncbi:MAG: VTT domain-containing protein [Deltaproteobacteria bacterium]|nr:VTT domain-containing protein [Deltaproteobacteria bacterium]
MRRIAPLLFLALVAALVLGGRAVRASLGIELEPGSIQGAVAALGWKGPALFVGLVTFRQFLFLPSAIVLPAGGVVFGALEGTLLGAFGILLSAALKYGLARSLGREWLQARFGAAVAAFERHAEAAGPLIVGAATAHPLGPMAPVFWASGFAAVPVVGFLVAVALAAPVRAFAFSFFGSTLLDPGTPRFWAATLVLLGVCLLPLAHRGFRARLSRVARAQRAEGTPTAPPPSPAAPSDLRRPRRR